MTVDQLWASVLSCPRTWRVTVLSPLGEFDIDGAYFAFDSNGKDGTIRFHLAQPISTQQQEAP